jgi:hypothetical protein
MLYGWILWKPFLNWGFLPSENSSLCQVGIGIASTHSKSFPWQYTKPSGTAFLHLKAQSNAVWATLTTWCIRDYLPRVLPWSLISPSHSLVVETRVLSWGWNKMAPELDCCRVATKQCEVGKKMMCHTKVCFIWATGVTRTWGRRLGSELGSQPPGCQACRGSGSQCAPCIPEILCLLIVCNSPATEVASNNVYALQTKGLRIRIFLLLPPPPSPFYSFLFESESLVAQALYVAFYDPEGFCFVLFCFVLFCFVLVWFGFFLDRVSLYIPGCLGTHSVDQAGLELRNLPASASRVLRLKVCATSARLTLSF